MGHIAANHSVWDLELENLSVESLLLIYADFRVKSYRDEKGREIIHFYTLREAFDVILSKLDDVDGAKRQRYQKVYVKLADFEAYMEELGVTTDLPADFALAPERERILPHKEKVLMEGQEVVRQLKYAAIAHNIRLMSIFRSERDFGNLIEAARSEPNWKNLRAYISIFEEYSTYMTERQKMMTLQFLYELLSHQEEDIRVQAAELMGKIVANFNDRYTKELPKGVLLPRKKSPTGPCSASTWNRSSIRDSGTPSSTRTGSDPAWVPLSVPCWPPGITGWGRPWPTLRKRNIPPLSTWKSSSPGTRNRRKRRSSR